jgi:NhaP-type Na+/H+ or K+/H+ antiporter
VTATAVVVVCVGTILWVALADRLDRADLTAPIFFTLLGLGAHGVGLDLVLGAESVTLLAEIALALVLFSDAARVRYADLSQDAGLLFRLLAIGLPLSVLAGTGLAHVLLAGVSGWAALLVGASLAPTDAGLGRAIVVNKAVPVRIRQTLNAESGLNDGIVTPVVTVAILAVAGEAGLRATETIADAATQLALGVGFGFATGVAAGLLLGWTSRHRWDGTSILPVAGAAVAVLAYVGGGEVGGNSFLAVFVAGLTFRHTLPRSPSAGADAVAEERAEPAPDPVELTELSGELGGYVVWFVVGAVVLPEVWGDLDWTAFAYAVVSLTLVRMVPVAVALAGSGLRTPTVLFIGWFGPRGLASVVFATLAAAELGGLGRELAAAIVLTVAISVALHGATAGPLAARYSRWAASAAPGAEQVAGEEPVARGTIRT